ncbi:MAG TPA: lipoyl(octanoyl) transferase LipB [Verrucomicrobiae bacterium]|nr:lipoyl(octanoyl) transferase LipB [Verrucomicrobiae bacterium]
MKFLDLGLIPFDEAYALQERLAAEIAAGDTEETVLFLQHPSVYTSGRGGDPRNLLDPWVRPVQTNRGGDVTWHGPGQLVCYPLLHLGMRGRDLHLYLRFLEEVLLQALREFRIEGFRLPGRTGVWTAEGKIASIGVGVRRWVTMHGLAVNADPDLSKFSAIHPCGIPRCPVTSMSAVLGKRVGVDEVRERVAQGASRLLPLLLPQQQ